MTTEISRTPPPRYVRGTPQGSQLAHSDNKAAGAAASREKRAGPAGQRLPSQMKYINNQYSELIDQISVTKTNN